MSRATGIPSLRRALALGVLVLTARQSPDLAVDIRECVPVPHGSLYLEVRGRAAAGKPVLLWLHGGPGGAERPMFELFNGGLERSFRVAYYDQRGAGRSFDPDAPAGMLTVAQHLADLDAIVEHLKAKQHVRRVILVGHSWGSLLAMLYAQRHPGNVSAVIGVSQVVAPRADQLEQYRFVSSAARRSRDDRTLDRLDGIGRPPLAGMRTLRLGRLVDRFGGTWHRRPGLIAMARAIVSGLVTPLEIPRFIRANERSVGAMTPELLTIDLRDRDAALQVPVIMFLGRYDHQISTATASAYWRSLAAPAKSLRWFEGSAHNIPFEEPAAFDACLASSLSKLPEFRGMPLRGVSCPYPELSVPNASEVPAARR